MRIHTLWRGTVVATDGTTLRVLHSWTEDLDFVKGTVSVSGLAFGTRVDRTSIKVMERGRLVIDLATGEVLFMAGKWRGRRTPTRGPAS